MSSVLNMVGTTETAFKVCVCVHAYMRTVRYFGRDRQGYDGVMLFSSSLQMRLAALCDETRGTKTMALQVVCSVVVGLEAKA
jgi:hypothetical protein